MEENYAQRKFGFCKIIWKIEHFCLVTCPKNWVLSSPEFSVRDPYYTAWMLVLKQKKNRSDGSCVITASLKRLDNDPGPEVIRANWKISILNGEYNKHNYPENEFHFHKATSHEVNVQIMAEVLKEFKPFDMDVLYIECQLIVSYDYAKFTTSIEQGIKLLSEDMFRFFLSKNINDVSLKIKDKFVAAHKAILGARNPTFATIFKNQPEGIGSIDMFLPFINIDALEKVVAYLYSGNLQTVIGKPSVSIYECASILEISEVLDYYEPDNLTIRSSVEPTEFTLVWFVREFESLNQEFILSPSFTEARSGTTWRLRLLPKGAENYNGFISVYGEIIDGMTALNVSFEIAISDAKNNFFCHRKAQKSMKFCGILGFGDFVSRDYLKNNSLLESGVLRIVYKVQMSTKAPKTVCESSSISIVTTNTPTEALKLFSEEMANMFVEGNFSDAVMICENRLFKVHKCIFASRSDTLSKIIWEKLRNETEIEVLYIKPDALNIILLYIYCGTIPDYSYEIIRDVYRNAEHFNMYGLMNKCLQMHNQNEH